MVNAGLLGVPSGGLQSPPLESKGKVGGLIMPAGGIGSQSSPEATACHLHVCLQSLSTH